MRNSLLILSDQLCVNSERNLTIKQVEMPRLFILPATICSC